MRFRHFAGLTYPGPKDVTGAPRSIGCTVASSYPAR